LNRNFHKITMSVCYARGRLKKSAKLIAQLFAMHWSPAL
jgi:hypothetical protein